MTKRIYACVTVIRTVVHDFGHELEVKLLSVNLIQGRCDNLIIGTYLFPNLFRITNTN